MMTVVALLVRLVIAAGLLVVVTAVSLVVLPISGLLYAAAWVVEPHMGDQYER